MSLTTLKPITTPRAASFKPKPKDAPQRKPLPEFDSLVRLPDGDLEKLTITLKNARNQGEKVGSGYRAITKHITELWNACKIRLGGDEELMKNLSLSEGMLVIYRDAETIDATFGQGTFKETKTATNGGASTWRKPWSRVRAAALGTQKVEKTPLERFTDACRIAQNSSEVSYAKAETILNRIFGKG